MRKRAGIDLLRMVLQPIGSLLPVKEWAEIFDVVITVFFGTVLLTIAPAIGTRIGATAWQSRIIFGLAFFAVLLLIAGWRLAYRVRKQETPVLDIIYDATSPAFRVPIRVNRTVKNRAEWLEESGYLFRVAVSLAGTKTVHNAEVVMSRVSPNDSGIPPRPLHPEMNQRGIADQQTPSVFSINPTDEPIHYVDVLEWNPAQQPSQRVTIAWHDRMLHTRIPQQDYEFELLVHGQNTAAVTKSFTLIFSQDGKPTFRPMSSE